MPKISVIIPVYNVEQYLEECLESVANQTIKEDLEVLIVNDGSPDKSQEIIDRYVNKYPKIFKSFIKENGGQGDARNFAIKYVTGEYLTFLDSDDYIKNDMYEKMYNCAKSNDYDLVMCDLLWIYPDGKTESRSTIPTFLKEFNLNTYILSNPGPVNKIFKTSIWKDNNIKFPIKLWYEDLAIIPAIVKYIKNIGYIKEELYIYRQRGNSTMSNEIYSERLLEIIPACENLYNFLIDSKYIQELEYLYIFQLIYYVSFRLLKYNKYKELEKCVNEVEKKFPDWKNNKYYKDRTWLFKLYCKLICKRKYFIVKLLMRLKGAK